MELHTKFEQNQTKSNNLGEGVTWDLGTWPSDPLGGCYGRACSGPGVVPTGTFNWLATAVCTELEQNYPSTEARSVNKNLLVV